MEHQTDYVLLTMIACRWDESSICSWHSVSTIFSLHGGLFTETMFALELSISYCLQTIAIIPVLPRGVLQLGSTSVVRYPCFSNWDYYIVYIVLHVLKLFSVIIIWPWCTTLWLCYIVDWSNVLFPWSLYINYIVVRSKETKPSCGQ